VTGVQTCALPIFNKPNDYQVLKKGLCSIQFVLTTCLGQFINNQLLLEGPVPDTLS
jgi:hypothetical protein